MNALPVRWIESHAWDVALNGRELHRIREWERQIDRVRSGETTMETEFGPSRSLEDVLQDLYDSRPDIARKYRLPAHLHWMGDR